MSIAFDSDVILFQMIVLPVIARQARESTPDKHAAESAAWSDIAASPYAHLVPFLQDSDERGRK